MSGRTLLIDNYDSFVFNLARYLQELEIETEVVRNNQITVDQVRDLSPDAILLSPGPCTPLEAGITLQLIRELGRTIPMLGVCLGHQAIGAAFGGNVIRAPEPVHGRTSFVQHTGTGLFQNCPQPLRVMRYHSLIVERASLPDSLTITAETIDGVIMGISHKTWPLHGVQFHPESVLTQQGHLLLMNFLKLAGIESRAPLPSGDLPLEPALEDDFFQRTIDQNVIRPY